MELIFLMYLYVLVIYIFLPDAKSDEEKQALRVASVDFNVAANAAAHHTSAYELTEERVENGNKIIPQLVVRRGQPFDIVIKFDRAYDKEKDDLRIVFDCGMYTL